MDKVLIAMMVFTCAGYVQSKTIPADKVLDEFLNIPGMRMSEYNFWWKAVNLQECARYCLEETRLYCQSFSHSEISAGCGTYENSRATAPEGVYGKPHGGEVNNGQNPNWIYYERKSQEYKVLEDEMNRLKNLTEISVGEATDVLSGFGSTLRAAEADLTEDEEPGSGIKVPVSPGELELMSQMLKLVVNLNPVVNTTPAVSEAFAHVLVNVSDSMIHPAHALSWNALQADPNATGVPGIMMSSEIAGRDVSERLLYYDNSTSIAAEANNVGMWMDIVEFPEDDVTSSRTSLLSSILNKLYTKKNPLSQDDPLNDFGGDMYVFPSKETKIKSQLKRSSNVTEATPQPQDSILSGDVIMLPRTALRNRSVVTHVRYKSLSQIMPTRDADEAPKNGTSFRVNSAVLTTSVYPKPSKEVFEKDPVLLIFNHHRGIYESTAANESSDEGNEFYNTSTPPMEATSISNTIEETMQCVYWEEGDDGTVSGWSTRGCELVKTNDTHTICRCVHLTSFAVLLKMVDTSAEDEVDPIHVQALNWISNVGCVLSLGGVIIMCGAFIMLKFHTENMKIHFNLGVAVGMADLVFLFEELAQGSKYSCVLVTVLLYYFNMAVLSWMLIEGLFLYSQVVVVFVSARRWVKYYVFAGWGIPAIVMGISMGILNVQLGMNEICWLSPADNSIWAFAAPAILVIFINFLILISVVKVIVNIQPDKTNNVKINKLKNAVKGSIFLSPLLGTTWLFGLLSLSRDTLVFQYLFATTNSLQGFFLFVFHCLCNSEVRADFSRLRNCKSSSTSGTRSPPWFSGSFGLNVATGLRKFRNSISFEFASSAQSSNSEHSAGMETPDAKQTPKNNFRKMSSIPDVEENKTVKSERPRLRRAKTSKSLPGKRRKAMRLKKREKTSLSQNPPDRSKPNSESEAKSANQTSAENRTSRQNSGLRKRSLSLPPLLSMPMKNDVILTGKTNRISPMTKEQQVCREQYEFIDNVSINEILDKLLANQLAQNERDEMEKQEKEAKLERKTQEPNSPELKNTEHGNQKEEESQDVVHLATNEVEYSDKEAFKIPMSYDSGLNSIDNESLLDEEYNDEFVEMPYGPYRVGIHGCDVVV